MPHLALIKVAANVIVTTSVGRVIGQAVKANTNPQTALAIAQTKVGSFAIGALVGGLCWDRTEVEIDKVATMVEKFKTEQEAEPRCSVS